MSIIIETLLIIINKSFCFIQIYVSFQTYREQNLSGGNAIEYFSLIHVLLRMNTPLHTHINKDQLGSSYYAINDIYNHFYLELVQFFKY